MCGIVGYVGGRPCRELLVAGLEKLEYRGYDSAGVSVLEDGEVESVRAVGNLANLRAAMDERAATAAGRGGGAAGDDRGRPHPLGDPRPGHRGERAPPQRQLRPGPHRPQRDRREPRQAARAAGRRRAGVQLRNRRRGRRPPDRPPLRRRPRRRGARRLRRAARPLRLRRDARRRARAAWSGPARSARWSPGSARARASSPRRSPPSSPRPAARWRSRTTRSSTIDASGVTITDAEGNPVERDAEEIDWDEAAAEKGGYETFMLKEIHEQADAVAETIAGRLPGDDGVDLSELELDDDFLRGLRRDRDRRLRHLLPRRPGRPLRDRGVGAGPGRDGHRLRVPLPQPGGRARRPGGRDHPVGRDRRHPGGDAAGPRARRQGAGDHQHHGQPGDPRRRRRPLHPRPAWRSASPRPRPSSPRSRRCTCSACGSPSCAGRCRRSGSRSWSPS